MTIFQVLILAFIVFVVFKASRRLIKKEISVLFFILWLIFWILVAIIDLFPNIIARMANFVGVGRGVDLIIYIAICVLLYVVFRYNLRINKLEKNITDIVRKVALNEPQKREGEE